MLYLSNAFSLNMLDTYLSYNLSVNRINLERVLSLLETTDFICAIGHKDTAAVVGSLLGLQLEANRVNVSLDLGRDQLVVAQYSGPRLPEGTTVLPEGAEIKFYLIQ